MRSFTALLILCLLLTTHTHAQQRSMDNVWPLQRCIQYAISHNITIKQDSLNARLARHALTQSQLSQLPAVNVSGSYGRSFGRSINPITNQFVETEYNFFGPSASSNVLLFGWNQVRNTIARNRYSLEASLADLGQRKDDIALNVANSYLIALLAQEQINISNNQVGLSKAQLDQTKAFAEAGRLPELNVAQLESQLASDSANLINAIANYNSAILDLKTLLNLDFSESFSIKAPDLSPGDQMAIAQTAPEEVYQAARSHFGSIKGSQLRVQSAEKALTAAKGNLYPQLNLSYQVGTNFASNYLDYQQTNELIGLTPIGITGTDSQIVYAPRYKSLTPLVPFSTQMRNNIRHSVVLNLNIPLFNSWQSQYAVRQARINLAQQELSQYSAELTLKQNVYKAHNNALNSIQKYNAAKRAEDAAKRALDFASKRYELGLTSTVDLLVTQNTEFATAANLISAKYDLIFKLKVIDYYMGKELKL
ncbi:MAG: TolC family protein [Taibaiella sp.]|nr:TolC family protein [Taibaiella sp.]